LICVAIHLYKPEYLPRERLVKDMNAATESAMLLQ